MPDAPAFDTDFLIIGSGFGGSVSALRLAEKGWRVLVLEQGRRWTSETLPKTNWDARNFLWAPLLRCFGIFRMTVFPHVFVLSGTGVGGGSLVYANTLLVPKADAWKDPSWRDLADWQTVLAPHYRTAQRMLGVAANPKLFAADEALRQYARRIGQEQSFAPTDVAIFFGEPGKTVPDPYFNGEGPPRAGCTHCGACMVGCRQNAKNTLDKNYLYLAERRSAQILPERRVTRIEPLPGGGYRVHSERSTALLFKDRQTHTTKNLVLSAGVLGTVDLLLECRDNGWLPALSPALGRRVRTNSEAILGVTQKTAKEDFSQGIAIGSRMDLDPHTHMEPVRYPPGASALALITTPLTDGGGSIPRWLRWIWAHLLAPLTALRALWPGGWSQRTVILLVMQTLENELRLSKRRRWFWPFWKTFSTELPPGQKGAPTWIPAANQAAREMAETHQGAARSSLPEALLDIPTTAHILGGCAMGKDATEGVIDWRCRVFGYEGMYVIDGSMIGANLGVNPSLTITAIAEHAMSHVEGKAGRGGGGQ